MKTQYMPCTLLLVEDNPADADLVQEYLEQSSGRFRVFTASRIEQAQSLLREQEIDVVLLDLRLPDSSGVETVRSVLSAAGQTPIIVLTGVDDEELALSCMSAGADDYLCKGDIHPVLLQRSIGYSIVRRKEADHRQQQAQRLVSASPDAVIVTSKTGTVRFVNEAALKLFDRRRGDFLGDQFQFPLQDGHVEAIHFGRGGARRSAEMRVVSFEWEGQPAYLASIRDNTERLHLEEKYRHAQRMEAIGRLAGGVAHDFNNLLTVILGTTELLREQQGEATSSLLLQDITNAAERARELTRQLLAFSRRSEAAPTTVQVNDLVLEAERFLQRLIGEDILLQTNLSGSLPTITADPMHITQIIMNLALNARDAMPRGGRLLISTELVHLQPEVDSPHPDTARGDFVRLCVSDTGIGMDEETLDRIFEPFFTTKPPGEGTGLGLATVYGFVSQGNGHIIAESTPGEGSCFRVHFPASSAKEKVPTPPQMLPAGTDCSKTILLVEDDDAVRKVVSRMLSALGYRVLEAADGAVGRKLAVELEGRFDLLLTDLVMPGMNGAALVLYLRGVYPSLPAIIMSGYSDSRVAPDLEQLHEVQLLQKPLTRTTLAVALQEALGRSQSGA